MNKTSEFLSFPAVSVVMPVYNGERFLHASVESILRQTRSHFELLIVDDGSTDQTPSIIAEFCRRDPRIRNLRLGKNQGIVAARNAGFQHVSPGAKYVAIMDSDDISRPERLALQIKFLETHPDCALVGGHTRIIDENGNVLGVRRYPLENAEIRTILGRESPFAQPAVMIRKSALDFVGPYNPKYRTAEDYDLWFRMLDKFKGGNVDEVVLDYRLRTNQMKETRLKETVRNNIDVQRRWIFQKRYFSALNVLNFIAEHMLLLLPNAWVMWMFRRLKYNEDARCTTQRRK